MKFGKFGAAVVLTAVTASSAWSFGGEDIARGKPWHHEHITLMALTEGKADRADLYSPAVTFPGGAESIAWHADNIDSYLYNPVFWAMGALESSAVRRTKGALVGFQDLAKLHFDDTFTNSGLRSNWERYAAGTLIGLYWASELPERDGIAAGHHLLGISFHAVQDFYAHSSWSSSPDRRCLTYFETPKDTRDAMSLFAGAYETPETAAPAHHGAYSLSCSALKREGVDSVMDTVCSGLSPMQNAGVCQSYRLCSGAGAIDAQVLGGGMLVYTQSKGIALDNTALSRAQAPNRGLIHETDKRFLPGKNGMHFPRERCSDIVQSEAGAVCEKDVDGDQVFAGTKDLAVRATMEWAEYLEEQMYALGKGAYWEKLKSRSSTVAERSAQYEDFSKLPYHFLASGPYPVSNPARSANEAPADARGWFLRLQIETADELGAGTNADIFARVKFKDGSTRDILLDYLPTKEKTGRTTNRLLVYNDFEAGDDDAYTIGPFNEPPVSVSFFNKSADFTEVLGVLAEEFSEAVIEFVHDALVVQGFGEEADYVGNQVKRYSHDALERTLSGGAVSAETLDVNGGDEGHHVVHFTLKNSRSGLTRQQREDGWISVEIELDRLVTVKESVVDRFSTADEPFVIFHVAPLNGISDPSHTYMSAPFDDMDSGDEARFRPASGTRTRVRIPPEGILVISTAVYESDSESPADREALKTQFVTGVDTETQKSASDFADALGRSIAEDWIVGEVEIYAFHRSARPAAGTVLPATRLGEVEGNTVSRELALDWSRIVDLGAIKAPLTLENPVPDAKTLLHGIWHSEDYQCVDKLPYVRVRIDPKDDDAKNRTEIIATKLKNEKYTRDECVDDIENGRTFRGTFEDGRLIGERYIVPPPRDRRIEFDPDNPLDVKPEFRDPAVDPHIGFEGNWIASFPGAEDYYAMVSLTKGGAYNDGGRQGDDWQLRFRRDPAARWHGEFWTLGNGTPISGTDSVSFSGSTMKVDWPYYMLGHWGGRSTLSLSADSMTGSWEYGDPEDPSEKGTSNWKRMVPKVTSVGVMVDDEMVLTPADQPAKVVINQGPYGGLRGNQPTITLYLYGEHLWGRQYFFMPRFTDIEYRDYSYICSRDQNNGSNQHRWWRTCMEQTHGVVGVAVTLTAWPRAYSGEHILYVNDQEIRFDLSINNEPLRDAEWQDMEMEFQSCNVLREVNRDYYDQPLRLVRSDFRPRGEWDN